MSLPSRPNGTGPNQLWHTDASYFFVVGWGYYYLITVLDGYSRMVLAWRVQPTWRVPASSMWSRMPSE